MKICSIEGCNKKHNSHGYCGMHYMRNKRHGSALYKVDSRGLYSTLDELFFSYINIDIKTDCWNWVLAHTGFGHGVMSWKGKMYSVHRYSYEKYIESIPNKMNVCHKCDNPRCCNPKHLFLGSQKDNMRDCANKGRIKRPPDDSKAKGEKVHGSKLTINDVIKIKKMVIDGYKNKEIALLFNVTHKNISLIRLNRTWKHIQLEQAKNDDAKI